MAQLVNTTTGRVVATDVARADHFLSRLVGLIGRALLRGGEGLWLEPCSSVHTLLMRFSVDVAFVDADGVVVACYASLRPWRLTPYHHGARACVELPAGVLRDSGVQVGHRLSLMEVRPAGR